MAKASTKKLDALHDMLAQYFCDQLESGEELSSGTLAAINSFLKNNNITADPIESQPLQNLSYRIQDMLKEDIG
jgi:hypothetical protein